MRAARVIGFDTPFRPGRPALQRNERKSLCGQMLRALVVSSSKWSLWLVCCQMLRALTYTLLTGRIRKLMPALYFIGSILRVIGLNPQSSAPKHGYRAIAYGTQFGRMTNPYCSVETVSVRAVWNRLNDEFPSWSLTGVESTTLLRYDYEIVPS